MKLNHVWWITLIAEIVNSLIPIFYLHFLLLIGAKVILTVCSRWFKQQFF